MTPRPNFFVIGAMKAGTTSVYHRLNEHPSVFMGTCKEPHFFSDTFPEIKPPDLEAYLRLFAGATVEEHVGEASTSYLTCPRAPQRIFDFAPDARIIAILRHPVERAFSHYLMTLNSRPNSFDPFEIQLQQARSHAAGGEAVAPGSGYLDSFYADGLARYYALFPAEQICVLTYDLLRRAPEELFARLFSFLGLEAAGNSVQAAKVENACQGVPRNAWLHNAVFADSLPKRMARLMLPMSLRKQGARLLIRRNVAAKPSLTPETRTRFTAYFADDIHRTEQLAGIDLSDWLAPSP